MSNEPSGESYITPPAARAEVDLDELEQRLDYEVLATHEVAALLHLARRGQSHEARLIEQQRDVLLAALRECKQGAEYCDELGDIIDAAIGKAEGTSEPEERASKGREIMTLKYTDSDLSATLAAELCRAVAELPDRTSPEDWPEAMLVTSDELIALVQPSISAALAKGREEAAQLVEDEGHMTLAYKIRALSPSSPGEPAGSGWQPISRWWQSFVSAPGMILHGKPQRRSSASSGNGTI